MPLVTQRDINKDHCGHSTEVQSVGEFGNVIPSRASGELTELIRMAHSPHQAPLTAGISEMMALRPPAAASQPRDGVLGQLIWAQGTGTHLQSSCLVSQVTNGLFRPWGFPPLKRRETISVGTEWPGPVGYQVSFEADTCEH